jgi:hypothetical protein
VYVEESGWPNSCYDIGLNHYSDDPSLGLDRADLLLRQLGCECVKIWYINRDTGKTSHGTSDELVSVIHDAELLINLGGVCWLQAFENVPARALVDLDPMFTQAGVFGKESFSQHNCYFSYGTNIGRSNCCVPTLHVNWIPTVPPVLADFWQSQRNVNSLKSDALTTIANWSAYGGIQYAGQYYGQKDLEFEKLLHLPSRVDVPLVLRVSGMPREAALRFSAAGWQIAQAAELNHSLAAYASFICSSLGEFSVAKHGYVKSRCGWISDRSVCYLAAGRPVIVQDTCDYEYLLTDGGVLLFGDESQAVEQIALLLEDREKHEAQAAKLGRQRFDYNVVLPRLVDIAMSAADR